jgi:hypothetical protein
VSLRLLYYPPPPLEKAYLQALRINYTII